MVETRVDDGARALPGLLASLEAAAIPVASVTVARPSLDEVYLHYAGRSWTDAEAAARSTEVEGVAA
jgi:ABC-2 type transport system ATP-binding protein